MQYLVMMRCTAGTPVYFLIGLQASRTLEPERKLCSNNQKAYHLIRGKSAQHPYKHTPMLPV